MAARYAALDGDRPAHVRLADALRGVCPVVTDIEAVADASRDWWPLAYLAVVGSIGAFTTFTWLIRRWPVTRMSFSAVIIPLVALMLGIVVLHERPGMTAILGATVVLTAVLIGLLGPTGPASTPTRR